LDVVVFGIPAGGREDVRMAVTIRVDDPEQPVPRGERGGMVDAGAVVDVERDGFAVRPVEVDGEVDVAVAVEVGEADRIGPSLPFVLLRQPLRCLVAEGAVAVVDQYLGPAPAVERVS